MAIKLDFSKFTKKIEESVAKAASSRKSNNTKTEANSVERDFKELFNSTNKNSLDEAEASFLDASKKLGLEEDEEEINAEETNEIENRDATETTPEEIKDIASNFSTGEVFEVPGESHAYIKTGDGEFEELDISMETYEKLFSGETQTVSGLSGLFVDNVKKRQEFNSFSGIYDDENSRYNFLKCFSEDEEGNVTVTIPSTQYSMTFNPNTDFDGNGFEPNTDIGIQIMSKTYNAMWQEWKISDCEAKIQVIDNFLDEESQNLSPEFISQIEEIFQYAKENHVNASYIYEAIDMIKKGENLEDRSYLDDSELNEMLMKLPKENLEKVDTTYLYNLSEKANLEEELEYFKNLPIGSKDMGDYYGRVDILSSMGLDINGNPISEEAYNLAQEFVEYSEWGENLTFNSSTVAAYLNDNPYGQAILNAVMNNDELGYNPTQITFLLEKGYEEDVDGDFLVKAASLNWPPSVMFGYSPMVTPENIDFAILFNENYDQNQEIPPYTAFDTIAIASKYIDSEVLAEYVKNGTYSQLEEANQYINSIIPNFINDGTTRSNLLEQDCAMVYQAAIEGIDVADLVVPTTSSIEEGMNNADVGDIFEVEGEDFIYIKTGDGEYEQLDISKDTYMELFPPVQRYMSEQGKVGDCYLVSSLNNMMTDPTTRHILLRCFSEDENGNVTVDLPNGDYTFTVEKGKSVVDTLPESIPFHDEDSGRTGLMYSGFTISNSSKGMQMLELCYGIYLKEQQIDESTEKLRTLNELVTIDEENFEDGRQIALAEDIIALVDEYITPENIGWVIGLLNELPDMKNEQAVYNAISQGLNCEDPAVITEFWNFYQDYVSNDYPIDYLIRKIDLDTTEEQLVNLEEDVYGLNLRGNGGWMSDVYTAFGFECRSSLNPSSTAKLNLNIDLDLDTSSSSILKSVPIEGGDSQLIQLAENPNVRIVAGGTYGSSDSQMLNNDLNIAERHAYTIYPVKQENGEWMFEVINPWDESRTTILTEDQMYEYFSNIDYIILDE